MSETDAIVDAATSMMVSARKQLDRILLDAGMTEKEIQEVVDDSMKGISINGVPLSAVPCEHCGGKGWRMP